MRSLVVYCHPVEGSFCSALRDTAMASLAAAGHETRLLDLYAMGFDPVMGRAERMAYNESPPPHPDLAAHVEAIRWAERIVFVYPTWWYGPPAMLKGWLERVWSSGVAFEIRSGEGPSRPLMTGVRRLTVVTTCGASRWLSFLMGQPGRKTILRAVRSLCAARCRTDYAAHYLMDSSTPASRAAFLRRVGRLLGGP